VDWELVSDQEFRDLLAALNFEASYDPTNCELDIGVRLFPSWRTLRAVTSLYACVDLGAGRS
jgi:hypothetical protein